MNSPLWDSSDDSEVDELLPIGSALLFDTLAENVDERVVDQQKGEVNMEPPPSILPATSESNDHLNLNPVQELNLSCIECLR